MSPLDIYAQCEPLLELEEPTAQLQDEILQQLQQYPASSLLDFGCGNGAFLERIAHKQQYASLIGVDASEVMRMQTQQRGFDTFSTLEAVTNRVDVITAIFDVLNFISPKSLVQFFRHVEERLQPNGHFIADINTLVGFEEVAPGQFFAHEENQHISIEATFDASLHELTTQLHYFSLSDSNLFAHHEGVITQYYYDVALLQQSTSLQLEAVVPISLYAEHDKSLLVFKKST